MSPDDQVALHQYIYGGHADIVNEALGKDCRHPTAGILSDGTANQVFEMMLPPALPATTKVNVDGAAWRRVDSLSGADPNDNVFVLSPLAGLVAFGDGVHGAIPPAGAVVTASYRSEHQGVFEYIRAMKAVDPSIEACTSWGSVAFIKAVKRPYGCFSIHSYTNFMRERTNHWANPLEGHDRIMIGCRVQRAYVQEMTSQLPPQTVAPMTEFGLLWGDTATWPDWMDSMSSALYMGSQWITWMRLGIPWATGNDLVVYSLRGLFSPSPDFDLSPTAIARIAIAPMFNAGGRNLVVDVVGNPIRNPGLGAGTYPGLSVASTHGPHGNLYLMVVNRMPFPGQSVRTTVHLNSFTSAGTMFIRTVTSPSYRSTAKTGDVALHTSQRAIAATRFSYRFPPHSITLLRIPSGQGT
jgi:alpha-N-arabinofuranosidase